MPHQLDPAAPGPAFRRVALGSSGRLKPKPSIEAYERYLSTPWFFRYEVDAYELGPALRRLAELYDARGERSKASATRTRLLALWRRADAQLQLVLADVRTRLTPPER